MSHLQFAVLSCFIVHILRWEKMLEWMIVTVPFNDMQTLKFKTQLMICVSQLLEQQKIQKLTVDQNLLMTVYEHDLNASVNSNSDPSPPPRISGAFFNIAHGSWGSGIKLVYPWAFNSLMIFTLQYCCFISMIRSSARQ